jgi:hypothetical protein
MPADRTYKVLKAFVDKSGKTWNVGDTYQNVDAEEINVHVEAGDIEADAPPAT